MTAGHLATNVSDRGLGYLPPIPGQHGGRPSGYLEVHTSSSALAPHLWIKSVGWESDSSTHVGVANAARFADQIVEAIATHYQLADNGLVGNLASTIHANIATLIKVLTDVQEGQATLAADASPPVGRPDEMDGDPR